MVISHWHPHNDLLVVEHQDFQGFVLATFYNFELCWTNSGYYALANYRSKVNSHLFFYSLPLPSLLLFNHFAHFTVKLICYDHPESSPVLYQTRQVKHDFADNSDFVEKRILFKLKVGLPNEWRYSFNAAVG